VTLPDRALPCSYLPKAMPSMLVLDCVDGVEARGLLLSSAVLVCVADRKLLCPTSDQMFSATVV
jgi:hypothetical protein